MIVHNAGRRFFPMKADAAKHASATGLGRASVLTLIITNRDELADLLNLVCNPQPRDTTAAPSHQVLAALAPAEGEPVDEVAIPEFVRRDWLRRADMRKAKGR